MALPKLLTSGEVLAALHVSRPTLRRLIDTGDLPATKVGGTYRFDEADVVAFLAAGRVRVSA